MRRINKSSNAVSTKLQKAGEKLTRTYKDIEPGLIVSSLVNFNPEASVSQALQIAGHRLEV